MPSVNAAEISDLTIARRLMLETQQLDDRRKGKPINEKTALDYFQEDQALISDSAAATLKAVNVHPVSGIENLDMNLGILQQGIQSSNPGMQNAQAMPAADGRQPADQAQGGITFQASQNVQFSLEVGWTTSAPVEGLVLHDKNFAESDRYLFNFKDGATFTIVDKWANKSTTIWGDPHVDVDDVEGSYNGEFSDLKGSDSLTTLVLQDGTRVRFNARDNGLIEQVDLFKGAAHITGLGQAAEGFSAEKGLFNGSVKQDGVSAAALSPDGDVVFAGGDGNDWYDANHKLVWGRTTGAIITQRPAASLYFRYKQSVTQSVLLQSVSKVA